MARPRKVINQKQFESLCAIQCTEEEICNVLDVSEKTLISWCNEVYGESFKVWKQALEEKFNGEYRVRFDKNYEVLSIGKYDRGYSRFSYTSYLGQGMKMSYQKAYILKYDMGANRDLEIVEV